MICTVGISLVLGIGCSIKQIALTTLPKDLTLDANPHFIAYEGEHITILHLAT